MTEKPLRQILVLLLALGYFGPAHTHDFSIGEVQHVATRQGVSVPIYARWRPDAVASVVLFAGGAGGYGLIGEDGWPAGGNFLIRTGKHWATYPFNVIMVGRPGDGIDLGNGAVRIGEQHTADNMAIFKAVKQRSQSPLWVVGTSMGTISATAAAIEDRENLIAGVVLSSSITSYKIAGAVPRQALEKIRVPTLILHHEKDACWACKPHEAAQIASELKNAPLKKSIFATGGEGASGNTCAPLHHHGYVGMQEKAVDLIAAWIIKPQE